ncbi:MAG: hypothetical protein K0Q50_2810 [Vampirovibrio sp.]|jgi:hypothetical protein|nr:hypothetical protein [Vampirovibrio sp.]
MKHPIWACNALSLAVLVSVSLSGTGAQALGLNELNTNPNNTVANTSQPLLSAPSYLGNLHKLSKLANQSPQIPQAQRVLNQVKQAASGHPDQENSINKGSSQVQLKVNGKDIGKINGTIDVARGNGHIVNHANLVTASDVKVQPNGKILLVRTGASEKSSLQANPVQSAVNTNVGLSSNAQVKVNAPSAQPTFPFKTAQAKPEDLVPARQIQESGSDLVQKQQDKAVDAIHSNTFAVNRKTAPWGVNIVTTHNKLQETTGITPRTVPSVK